MFVTPLKFEQVLERFYNQSRFDFLLLFVSSFDGNDCKILNKVVDNAKRIDSITGERICFFYFIKDSFDEMNEEITRWVRNISDWENLYGEGVGITMETADDICSHFGILRSHLPAFILVNRDTHKEPCLFSIQDYNDFESILTPLNVLHHYIEDKKTIMSRYGNNPTESLLSIRRIAIEKLNIALNSHIGEKLISDIQNERNYAEVVLQICELVKTRSARLSSILERVRFEIYEHGFDVFISCKSQDYAMAKGIYDYLRSHGFNPFLADASIKEIGIDQYTALIGEAINVCQNMIVFATDISYIETPYVSAEWHTFINDINTGHKPNAKIVTILSPDIDIHLLPVWLRDKQSFTTTNYRDDLLSFLKRRME